MFVVDDDNAGEAEVDTCAEEYGGEGQAGGFLRGRSCLEGGMREGIVRMT